MATSPNEPVGTGSERMAAASLELERVRGELERQCDTAHQLRGELMKSQEALEEARMARDRLRGQLEPELWAAKGALHEAQLARERLYAELSSATDQMAAYLEYHERNVDLLADSPSLAALQARLGSLEQMRPRMLQLEEQARRLDANITSILSSRIWRTLVRGARFIEYFLPSPRGKS